MTKASVNFLKRLGGQVIHSHMYRNYGDLSVKSSEYINIENLKRKTVDKIISCYERGLITEMEATESICREL